MVAAVTEENRPMSDDGQRTEALRTLLERRDLTDPAQGRHSMQELVARLCNAVDGRRCRSLRTPPLVPAIQGWRARHATTETVLAALPDLVAEEQDGLLLSCAGVVCGNRQQDATVLVAHQLDCWILGEGRSTVLSGAVGGAMAAALPGVPYRLLPQRESRIGPGFRVDVLAAGQWQEVGLCGVLETDVTVAAGFSLMLEPLLAVAPWADQAPAAGMTQTVTSSRS